MIHSNGNDFKDTFHLQINMTGTISDVEKFNYLSNTIYGCLSVCLSFLLFVRLKNHTFFTILHDKIITPGKQLNIFFIITSKDIT